MGNSEAPLQCDDEGENVATMKTPAADTIQQSSTRWIETILFLVLIQTLTIGWLS
jgi:hypothetical protein